MSSTPAELEALDAIATEAAPEAGEYGLVARLGAEAFGTFVLVFLGVGAALYNAVNSGGASLGILGIGLAFGVGVIAAASAVGHVSGGHFNPAVTLGAAVAGRTAWRDVVPYWLSQVAGGTLAAALLFVTVPTGLPALLGATSARGLFSGTANGFGETSPTGFLVASALGTEAGESSFGLLAAALAEVIATAIFVGVILAVTRKGSTITFAPVVIGLTLGLLLVVIAPITNGSINPARSFAAALFSDSWALGQLWLFVVAPLLGATLAALVYLVAHPAEAASTEWLAGDDDDAEGDDDAAEGDGAGDEGPEPDAERLGGSEIGIDLFEVESDPLDTYTRPAAADEPVVEPEPDGGAPRA